MGQYVTIPDKRLFAKSIFFGVLGVIAMDYLVRTAASYSQGGYFAWLFLLVFAFFYTGSKAE